MVVGTLTASLVCGKGTATQGLVGVKVLVIGEHALLPTADILRNIH